MLLLLLACAVDKALINAPASDKPDADDRDETESATDADTNTESGTRGPPMATWCYTAHREGHYVTILAFDMATGDWEKVGAWNLGRRERISTIEALATDGEHWVVEDSGWGDLYVLDRTTEDVTSLPYETDKNITWAGGKWVVWDMGSEQVEAFNSLDDLAAGTASGAAALDAMIEQIAMDGDDVYGAWHSTDEVYLHEAYAYTRTRTIDLEDWDTWVSGMSVAGNKLHLIDDGRQYDEQRIVSFDPDTGAQIEALYITEWPSTLRGLWCTTEAPS